MKINLVMAEFGSKRQNAGGMALNDADRLNPSLGSFLKVFSPEHEVHTTVYTDQDFPDTSGIEFIKKKPIFDKTHPRFEWRCNDYYKVYGLLEARADIAISLDADMFVASREALTLLEITKKFGVCLPANGRHLVKIDGNIGCDGNATAVYDASGGNGFANNMSPISFDPLNTRCRSLLEEYCLQMESKPVRGPLAMWRAQWKTGINPYILPLQWCVCNPDQGIGNEIILHVGHQEIVDFYFRKAQAGRS